MNKLSWLCSVGRMRNIVIVYMEKGQANEK